MIDDILIMILIILGFSLQIGLIIYLNRCNRKYAEKITSEMVWAITRNTILLVGKVDESTDASAMALNGTNRIAKTTSDTKEIVKDTKEILEEKLSA